MPRSENFLGGRLSLLDPATLDADQQKLHVYLAEKILPWAAKTGFQAATATGQPIGPFNPMLRSPRLARASLDLTHAEQEHSALSKRVREVVILSVGVVWQAPYELYAHTAAGRTAGLAQADIDALVAGEPAAGLSSEERLARELTLRLLAEHQLDQSLYTQGLAAFGEKGLVDLLFLVGLYVTTCLLLNAFTVPAPADGPTRL